VIVAVIMAASVVVPVIVAASEVVAAIVVSPVVVAVIMAASVVVTMIVAGLRTGGAQRRGRARRGPHGGSRGLGTAERTLEQGLEQATDHRDTSRPS
jgi:hypothetical protein